MSNKEYYHDLGGQHAAEGRYDPPHGFIDEFTTLTESGYEKNQEENDAYDKGFENGREQIRKQG